MWWTVVVVAAVVALLLVLVGFGAWAFRTANRLDRLHVRYDLSWQALDAALARRAVVARTVAANALGGSPDTEGKELVARADAAEALHVRTVSGVRTTWPPRWRRLIRPRCPRV